MTTIPETHYAKSGNTNLAYQVMGEKGEYLVFIPGWVTNIEEVWNIPQLSAWLRVLSASSRLVLFDKRGTGLSDNVNEQQLPDIQQRAEDLKIIMGAIGIERANFIGLSEGGPLAIYLAANDPDMVHKLILIGSFPKWIKTDDYPYGLTREQHERTKKYLFENWGQPVGLHLMAPSVKDNEMAQTQWARFLRRSASPGTAKVFYAMNIEIDIRHYLESITVPTLIMHRKEDALIAAGHSRYLHEKIAGSQLILSEGKDHLPWFGVKRNEIIAILTFLHNGKAVYDSDLDILTIEDIFTLHSIKEYIQNNLQATISIRMLTRKFGINEYKVKKGFRLLFNTPVIAYLSDMRLETAKELIANPNASIVSVSEQVGYAHPNNFSVAFKRKFGLSPLKYRATLIKN